MTETTDLQAIRRLAYTIDEAAQAIGCSPNAIRQAITDRQLPARQVGRRWIISARALERWVEAR